MAIPKRRTKTLQGRVAKRNTKTTATARKNVSKGKAKKEVEPRFNVKCLPREDSLTGNKRKRSTTSVHRSKMSVDLSELDKRLNLSCEIGFGNIDDPWYRMKSYNTFKLGADPDPIHVGDYIYVNNGGSGKRRKVDAEGKKIKREDDEPTDWVAKVIECRAADSEHVWLLVAWFMEPEDLPQKRQPYHAANEIIATNQMDIIDAMTVNDKADDVDFLDEYNDNSLADGADGFFWRQTFNILDGSLGELRRYCVCQQYANPSVKLVKCLNCDLWMHQQCLKDDIVAGQGEAAPNGSPKTPSRIENGELQGLNDASKPTLWDRGASFLSSIRGKGKNLVKLEEETAKADADSDLFDPPTTPDKGKKPHANHKTAAPTTKRTVKLLHLDDDDQAPLQAAITETEKNKKRQTWSQPVKCLRCRHIIE